MSSTKHKDFEESDKVDNIFRAAHFALIFLVSVLILVYIRSACKMGKVDEIYQILQTPLSINNILGLSSEELSIGLMWACSNGHIKDSRVPIDIINKEGLTPEQHHGCTLIFVSSACYLVFINIMRNVEHWKRIHQEIDKISEQVRSTVQSLRDQNCVSENDVYLDTLRVKLNELSAKTKLLESKEKVELDRLFQHFRKEEIEVHSKYEAETQSVRTSIEDDIRKLKSIMS